MDSIKVKISLPKDLIENASGYDFLLIAHHLHFEEIKKEAITMGVSKEKIIMPYEV